MPNRRKWLGYMEDENRLMEYLNLTRRPSADDAALAAKEAIERLCGLAFGPPLYDISAEKKAQAKAAIGEILANLMVVAVRANVRLDEAYREEFARIKQRSQGRLSTG